MALLIGAEAVDRAGAEADPRRQGDPDRLVHPSDLFDRQAQGQEVPAAAVPLLGVRRELGAGEIPDGPLKGEMLLAGLVIHQLSLGITKDTIDTMGAEV